MHDQRKWTAIVVAGDRGKSHPVFGNNKAFLKIRGIPVITRVVSALDESRSVSEIRVVGPKEKLEEALLGKSAAIRIAKPVHILEQRNNLYENAWYASLEALPSYRRGEPVEKIAQGPDADIPVLGVAGDMPLLTSAEIDEFVSKWDGDKHDYVIGVTEEEHLRHFYPTADMSGIHQAYMHFREGNLRQNNLQMVRPLRVLNLPYIQIMYDLRYQKEFFNMARLAWKMLNKEEGGWGTVGNYFLMQLSLTFERLHLKFPTEFVRNRTHIDSVVGCIGRLLKTRLDIAYTSLGGAALDIDCEGDFNIIEERFPEWMEYQKRKADELTSGVLLR